MKLPTLAVAVALTAVTPGTSAQTCVIHSARSSDQSSDVRLHNICWRTHDVNVCLAFDGDMRAFVLELMKKLQRDFGGDMRHFLTVL